MHHFLVVYHGISHVSLVFSRYTHDPLGVGYSMIMVYYEKAVHNAIENKEANTLLNFGGNKIAAHRGKVGYNIVEYAF